MTPENITFPTSLKILLAGPRGFCAGVDRAVLIVERAIAKYGAPVYVRHEIVHNRHVVERLEAKGAIFVDHLSQCPDDRPVIFSAHGVPKSVPAAAQRRNMTYIDATCPLVGKVHREAERHYREKRHIVLIGHAGHPEVIGTMGQLPEGAITLLETVADAQHFTPPGDGEIAYVTQTTLSVDETTQILQVLHRRFPAIHGPNSQDICYATTNRQKAVKAIAARSDMVLVIGAPNSSNSLRLVDVAGKAGCPRAALITRAGDIDWRQLQGVKTLGVTAGASAPEDLVMEVVEACRKRFAAVVVEETVTATENISFKLPRELAA